MTSPLPPRGDTTAVLGSVPIRDRDSSRDVADLLGKTPASVDG
ncbi:MAG: hypothetical protein ACJ72W_30100 [Actinoallomurus sp.]